MNNTLFKYNLIQQTLANYLCGKVIGDQLETFEALSQKLNVGRGTIQTAVKELITVEAFDYHNSGRNGRIITFLNYEKLIKLAGVNLVLGVMPLPYSRRYEGLATGIFTQLNQSGTFANLAFMSGSKNRLNALMSGRYDFIVVSKQTADIFLKEHDDLVVAKSLCKKSFIKGHIIASHVDVASVDDLKRIGVDFSSDDQKFITDLVFKDKNVEFVPIRYSNLVESIVSRNIDGAIWSADNFSIYTKKVKVLQEIDASDAMNETIASVMCLKKNGAVRKLLQLYLDGPGIEEIQSKIIDGSVIANY